MLLAFLNNVLYVAVQVHALATLPPFFTPVHRFTCSHNIERAFPMNKTTAILTSSVGRKVIMALTGFFLFSFLIVHVYVNLFLFMSDRGSTFDSYAEFMATYPLLRPIEIVLFAGFLIHGAVGVWLWLANRASRGRGYRVNKGNETSTLASRIMFWTGVLVTAFLVVHINDFFISSRFFPDGRTMFATVRDAFRSPVTVVLYVLAMIPLAYHLRHGFQSAFQTLGLRVGRYQRLIELLGILFWLVIPACFAAMPLYFFWAH
jgi:succinate dehydrogenase / fumarate reductase, cytochrome b subunit